MFSGRALHLDGPLLIALLFLSAFGLIVIFSASGEDWEVMVRQGIRLGISLVAMVILAQVSPETLRRLSPHLFLIGLAALLGVLFIGVVAKGAQRWLDLGLVRFQPSELMKLAVPMAVAWLLTRGRLPPGFMMILAALMITLIPAGLVVVQPDLGTGIMLIISGMIVVFLAGIRWHHIMMLLAALAALAPFLWSRLDGYQQQRVLTLFDPFADPLGSGYQTIQAQIAIGSAGTWGKGWLEGSQSHLEFIPERSTDFIFAVFAEEFGLMGVLMLVILYLFIVGRCLVMAYNTRETYSRLLMGALALTFFFYLFVNLGMVSGILPIVGVPLPLVSYGGTSMLTLMAGFGMIMGMHARRRLMT
ncbi:MAG TPA: rod shape-determining protein RodA [Gammaproteobacteria bacterium]|jgi:rod shape determining protein RodA|nr:rod shape-determining protein RodA [Acidiferrobacteraceae bacterium]MDP6397504.1 rod shape-determining protein RodA [Arenicellales bacterium]HCX87381.1 rod shape-determining protein RodA [Gammaproteobacteria bacterium]MDP6553002.1 rod shape-determining protein RodA [Arenicellales bacterium]MDP6792334.1 rod shape-determining protein RodA [Arenicellales bacterium]|tara:strand:- start:4974 stop:6053 length:1080 start_codon:yes stop_codon:yes gene_type:complete